jgi:glycerate kinase
MLIPERLLVASGPFASLSAATVAAAIARGVREAGLPDPDVCVLETTAATTEFIRASLDRVEFDARLRRARAVVVACEELEERTLAGSVTFEIATRARQGGVPAYAVTAHDELDPFDARILDLQAIVEARSPRALVKAGGELAALSFGTRGSR